MATGGKVHGPHILGDGDQWHPHGQGMWAIQWPVVLILVPGRVPAPSFFEQRLIVVDPDSR
jgi:hypothetical protein